MAKNRKQTPNKQNEKYLTRFYSIAAWLFVGLIVWFLLVNSASTLRMNDETTTFFVFIGLAIAIITIVTINPIIKNDIEFSRRYERWNLLAYFTPVPLFIISMSLIIILPIPTMVFPYWVHKLYAHNKQVKFIVSEKREYTVCPGVDDVHNNFKVTGCYDVKDICIKNKQFNKYQFCTEILSEEDWEKIKKRDVIVLKGGVSYLGIEPKSYALADGVK